MHEALVKVTVEKVRQRHSEGDCPVTPAYSAEWLGEALLSLATDNERLNNMVLTDQVWRVGAHEPGEFDPFNGALVYVEGRDQDEDEP